MGIMKKKEAYVTKGTRLIEEKKLPEATEVVVDGLELLPEQDHKGPERASPLRILHWSLWL